MRNRHGSRALVGLSCVLALVLAVIAVMQYRWATLVAEGEALRTKANLENAADLFARDFDRQLVDVYLYLQNQGAKSLEHGGPFPDAPQLIRDFYYFDSASSGRWSFKRADRDGSLHNPAEGDASSLTVVRHYNDDAFDDCASSVLSDVPAVVAPIPRRQLPSGPKVHHAFIPFSNSEPSTRGLVMSATMCLVARLDQGYLLRTTLPEMIQRYFGAVTSDFDFAILRFASSEAIYGRSPRNADVKQTFFELNLDDLRAAQNQGRALIRPSLSHLIDGQGNEPAGSGPWELQITRKGNSISSAVAGWRRQNVFLSASTEVLLLAAIGFLVGSARKMQQLADQKMQFVAGVSHELRTPAAAIAVLARNQADGLAMNPDQVRKYGALMHQQSKRLVDMVEQILQFAGIHSAHRMAVRTEVDVPELIERIFAARRDEVTRAGFKIEGEFDKTVPSVLGDPVLLEQAVHNLISNAEKYSTDQRWIRVSVLRSQSQPEVLITVEDKGIGIEPAEFDQIFDPFCRGRRAIEMQIPGSGMGLSLVRGAIEAQGGTVTFESVLNQGSSFTLHLPIAPSK
jgi:two-component system sensor histidine kinase SenX3